MSSIERVSTSYLTNQKIKSNEAAAASEQVKNAVPQKNEGAGTEKTTDLKSDRSVSKKDEARSDNQMVKKAIAEVNKKMNRKTRCEFSYHEDTKRVAIRVIDANTDEVIREIPPEETLDMLTKMWEAAGILLDETR